MTSSTLPFNKTNSIIKTYHKKRFHREDNFQLAVATLMDLQKRKWFHTPNEGKRSLMYGGRLKRAGLKAGIPDVICIEHSWKKDYCGFVIELKTKGNSTTLYQKQWLRWFKECNRFTDICYSLDEFLNDYNAYFNTNF